MAKKKMKNSTKNVLKIIISIIYIIWGIYAPIQAFGAIVTLDLPAMMSATVGVLTLLAGIFGLFGMKKKKCRIFGAVIFVFSLISVAVSLMSQSISITSIINALLAWLFIVCVQ